ncbi:MAG: hypothetical protein PUH25_05515 [Spirochaetales bacterium]|nr:hypothetical protein [Spirochaetales bacterium]
MPHLSFGMYLTKRFLYKKMGIKDYIDWYYQKKTQKDILVRNLPSQTAKESSKAFRQVWEVLLCHS